MGLIAAGMLWTVTKVTKGLTRSMLSTKLEELGVNLGNVVATQIDHINKKLEAFNSEASQLRGHKIKAKLIRHSNLDSEPNLFGSPGDNDDTSKSSGNS